MIVTREREAYVHYTTPAGDDGFACIDDIIAVEDCKELGCTLVLLSKGGPLRISENAKEMMNRIISIAHEEVPVA